jgi:hypothetical protein
VLNVIGCGEDLIEYICLFNGESFNRSNFSFSNPESKFVKETELFCDAHDRVDVVSC